MLEEVTDIEPKCETLKTDPMQKRDREREG
jgi:hypothetical protein